MGKEIGVWDRDCGCVDGGRGTQRRSVSWLAELPVQWGRGGREMGVGWVDE